VQGEVQRKLAATLIRAGKGLNYRDKGTKNTRYYTRMNTVNVVPLLGDHLSFSAVWTLPIHTIVSN
jgi:hypothetical protein